MFHCYIPGESKNNHDECDTGEWMKAKVFTLTGPMIMSNQKNRPYDHVPIIKGTVPMITHDQP